MSAQQGEVLPVVVIGGGMITREVILPTLFQERRRGAVGEVCLVSRRAATVRLCQEMFPGETLEGVPDPGTAAPEASHPEAYLQALDRLGEEGLVVVATPDHLHTEMVLAAIERGLHCVVQKPLCLKAAEARAIREAARQKGAYVLTDYHKRHDRAVRAARTRVARGDLGEMLCGHAWIEERREMPLHWFARWCDQSSPFEYIGVHYADAYYFITGLLPRRLAAWGQKKLLPAMGKDAFDAVQAAIEWEDGSVLYVQTSWVLAEGHTALTKQGLQLTGTQGEYWADHKDRNCYFCTQEGGFEHYNPNFFRGYIHPDDPGRLEYVGYGYESIAQGIGDVRRILAATRGLEPGEALERRRQLLAELEPVRALPSQALVGTAINEAVRLSIDAGGAYVTFGEDLAPCLASGD
ncbi:MAG: Gfo/Idh/MocA family oxidoreductase [bacterium]